MTFDDRMERRLSPVAGLPILSPTDAWEQLAIPTGHAPAVASSIRQPPIRSDVVALEGAVTNQNETEALVERLLDIAWTAIAASGWNRSQLHGRGALLGSVSMLDGTSNTGMGSSLGSLTRAAKRRRR